VSQTCQAPTPTSHSALHLLSTDHAHLQLISSPISTSIYKTLTHSLSLSVLVRIKELTSCLPQGLPVLLTCMLCLRVTSCVSSPCDCRQSSSSLRCYRYHPASILQTTKDSIIILSFIYHFHSICKLTCCHLYLCLCSINYLICDLLSPARPYCNRRPDPNSGTQA